MISRIVAALTKIPPMRWRARKVAEYYERLEDMEYNNAHQFKPATTEFHHHWGLMYYYSNLRRIWREREEYGWTS